MDYNKLTYTLPINVEGNGTPYAILSHTSYVLEAGGRVPLACNEFLGLHFNLGDDLAYAIDGVPPGTMLKNKFNMAYIPQQVHGLYDTAQQTLTTFSIHLPVEFLKTWESNFPILNKFFRKMNFKLPILMGRSHLAITNEMLKAIDDILYNRFTGMVREIHIRARIYDVIKYSLEQFTADLHAAQLLNTDEIKIQEIHNYLLQNIQHPCSLGMLASKFDIDKRKLLNGFKKLYKTTVIDFLIAERLKKAAQLLRETTIPIGDVATTVGYKNLSYFADSFRKKYGYSASSLRKRVTGKK